MWNTHPVQVRTERDVTRRAFLGQAAAAAAGLGLGRRDAWPARLTAQAAACTAESAGAPVRTLPLYGVGADEVPLGRLLGRGLDARQYTDLSGLAPGALVTPRDQVFIRSTPPPSLPALSAWTVTVRSADGRVMRSVPAATLAAQAPAQGAHVIECAGNANPWNFGLMSAPSFGGVSLASLVDLQSRPAGAAALLVTGHDHTTTDTRRSLPGASWILPVDAIGVTGAFLATSMDGAPLTADHGAPVRLVVPGWYGCAWIKWVHDLQWVDAEARSTTQMLEFAFRTQQDGIPMRAADYLPPDIDTAAMPIRVEERRVDGRTEYLVVGLMWGGQAAVDRLLIRFGSRDAGAPVTLCGAASGDPWRLWTYRWRPEGGGPYDITLKAADPAVRTRRLDLGYYVRRVHI